MTAPPASSSSASGTEDCVSCSGVRAVKTASGRPDVHHHTRLRATAKAHPLVRKSASQQRQAYSSQRRGQADPAPVIKVRCHGRKARSNKPNKSLHCRIGPYLDKAAPAAPAAPRARRQRRPPPLGRPGRRTPGHTAGPSRPPPSRSARAAGTRPGSRPPATSVWEPPPNHLRQQVTYPRTPHGPGGNHHHRDRRSEQRRVVGGPGRAAAHDQIGRRPGDGSRPAQRVSEREKDDHSLNIEPRTAAHLPRPLAYGSHDSPLIQLPASYSR